MSARHQASARRTAAATVPVDAPSVEVAAFIRFCHGRRGLGWPEIYDEMCSVVNRREFNGWGPEQFAAHGVTLSLFEMPRLAAWVRAVLAGAGGRPGVDPMPGSST